MRRVGREVGDLGCDHRDGRARASARERDGEMPRVQVAKAGLVEPYARHSIGTPYTFQVQRRVAFGARGHDERAADVDILASLVESHQGASGCPRMRRERVPALLSNRRGR